MSRNWFNHAPPALLQSVDAVQKVSKSVQSQCTKLTDEKETETAITRTREQKKIKMNETSRADTTRKKVQFSS